MEVNEVVDGSDINQVSDEISSLLMRRVYEDGRCG